MAIKKEEMEFQLEMLRVQIMHRDLWSAVTLPIAILFPTMISLAITYMNFYFTSGNLVWAFWVIEVLVIFPITMLLILRYYSGRGSRTMEKNLQEEIQKIRKKFIDKKPLKTENSA
jgi:hypothetical protein